MPPHDKPVHAIPWPATKRVRTSSCRGAGYWPIHLSIPQPTVQANPWLVKRNFLDAAMLNKNNHLPVFRAMKLKACLKLNKTNKWLGPWYVKAFAGLELRIKNGAKICLNLTGNRKGLLLNGFHNPIAIIRGISMDSWSENAVPREVNIYDNRPILTTKYSKTWYYFWKHYEELSMNPLINFRDKIPIYYRISDGRRLSLFEYRKIYGLENPDPSEIKKIPLIHPMVFSGRVQNSIPLSTFLEFIKVWSKTWSKKRKPGNYKEKIARELGAEFSDSIAGIEGTILLSPDMLMLPGFYAKFTNTTPPELQYVQAKGWPYRPDNTYMINASFKAHGLGQKPHHMTFESKMALDEIYVRNIIDLGKTSANVKVEADLTHNGSNITLHIDRIRAHLNPFRYGGKNPALPATVETIGGIITDGRYDDFIPPGFNLTKNEHGDLTLTANLNTEHHIKTYKGEFSIGGNFVAGIGAAWTSNSIPQIKPGETRIEIRNFRLYQKGKQAPLISDAKLIITDDPSERKILAVAHPRFKTGKSGFIVRIEFGNLRGMGYDKGYLVGFIPVPRNSSGKFYDPRHFSVQNTLNIAFGLVTKNKTTTISGDFNISNLEHMRFTGRMIYGRGVEIKGNVLALSGMYTRYLLKKGNMKLLSKMTRTEDGSLRREWFALIRADYVGLRNGTIFRPSLRARFSVGAANDRIYLRIRRMSAGYRNMHFNTFSAGIGMLSGKASLSYNRLSRMLHINKLGAYFSMNMLAPKGLVRASRGRITSFDIDGYLGGHWLHNLRTNRGYGWIGLSGDKEGDIHLRDYRGKRIGSRKIGRETPLFSDTRWIALRIDGVDPRGWINGQFCLRTDIDLMALRPMGIKHSDYIEWIMSHDNIALPAGILARSEKYYRDLFSGKPPSAGRPRNGDVCRRIFSRMK